MTSEGEQAAWGATPARSASFNGLRISRRERRTKSLSIAIGRALRPFPRSKRSRPVSRHSAFQLGHCTLTEQTCRYRQRSAPAGYAAVICCLHSVCWRSFPLAYPGSLRRVRPITERHLTTMLPLPSVPHAGIFASLAGKVVSEFPDSTKRCVIAPCSCLLDAGG